MKLRSFFAFAMAVGVAGVYAIFADKADSNLAELSGYAFFSTWSLSGETDVGEIKFPKLGISVDTSRVRDQNVPYDARTINERPDVHSDVLKLYTTPGQYKFSFVTNVDNCSAGTDRYVLPESFETSFGDQKDPRAEKLLAVVKENTDTEGETKEGIAVYGVKFPNCILVTITRDGIAESARLKFD